MNFVTKQLCSAMKQHNEFLEFLKLLDSKEVDFTLIGGYAVAFHGFVRYTGDIDILYRLSEENTERLKSVLIAFGFPESAIESSLFDKGNIIRIGVPPVRIELLNEISGVTQEEVWEHRISGTYGQIKNIHFISIDDLRRNKKAAGRDKDLRDLKELE